MDDAYKVFSSNLFETIDLCKLAEVISGRLYLATYSTGRRHQDTDNLHFINFDRHEDDVIRTHYFYKPNGCDVSHTPEPLNLGCLIEYIRCVNDKMYNNRYTSKVIVHYTTDDFRNYNNAALFVGTYAIVVKQMDPRTIHSKLLNGHHRIKKESIDDYVMNTVDLYDCLSAIYKAVKYKLIDFYDFNRKEYGNTRKLFTWIVPNKFIAFRDPAGQQNDLQFYLDYFRKNNVKTVIRLNHINYDSTWFSNVGIEHVDLFFEDGLTPSNTILQTFLNIAEHTSDAIAVHCKAGLGRTGTLIAAYLIQHFRMTAREAIAWVKICRPGSIMGPLQQSFLMNHENSLWKKGDVLRKKIHGHAAKVFYCTRAIYSRY